ncbi:MAG: type II secretion system minor pseudopilin GspI [Magnetococcus sp. YQC-5]
MKGSDAGGFSLLETVAALLVLSVALSAALQSAAGFARNGAYLRDRTLAHWVAMNQATERRVRKEWPEPGVVKGHDRMGNRDWYWTILFSSTPEAFVRRMEIQVRMEAKETTQPLVRLEAFLVKP